MLGNSSGDGKYHRSAVAISVRDDDYVFPRVSIELPSAAGVSVGTIVGTNSHDSWSPSKFIEDREHVLPSVSTGRPYQEGHLESQKQGRF